ncbi:hypothetical protein K1T71_006805 [Dendrolimus kikuchii]|uniref:Uncharacterized protein n=1 Tax=Dendrolimus kikuchii TaxID=765133 RepID=A0ACC1D273_9NEOP|nr:hypothetical protein K1T71_006805 [Dendrolimus kikuchii]
MEDVYLHTLTTIESHIKQLDQQPTRIPQKQTNNTFSKLPHIDIPTFTGKYSDYNPFIDLFDALIHNNTNIENVQRLFYLRNSLQGEPLDLIKNLPLVGNSYLEAKTLLHNRYNNRYKITNEHINILLDIAPITKSTALCIRSFVSTIKQQLAALRNLNHNVEQWDAIVLCILTRKLDILCNREFQLSKSAEPTVQTLLDFLDNRALALENAEKVNSISPFSVKASHIATARSAAGAALKESVPPPMVCALCKLHHKLFNCPKFKLMSAADRLKFVLNKHLCKICLNDHKGKCRYFFKCGVCKEKHNSLLHQEEVSPVALLLESSSKQVLLPTAKVKVIATDGTELHVKALLDSGSQVSFITSELVHLLNIQPKAINVPVIGIGNSTCSVNQYVNIPIYSNSNKEFCIRVTAYIMDNITTMMPQTEMPRENFKLPPGTILADSSFYKPSVIHILLGADIFFQVLLPNRQRVEQIEAGGSGLYVPVLDTQFGCVLAGSLAKDPFSNIGSTYQVTSLFCQTCENSLNDTLSSFWKTESIPETFPEKLPEHEECEKLFSKTVQLNSKTNRFQVALPLKLALPFINKSLGHSFDLALKRFKNLENRFLRDHNLYKLYKEFIEEYIQQGHATIIDISQYDLYNDPVYFLPHHPVLRLDKKTTKCRVVFDGSMKTSTKVSLNDMLMNGPVVQNELLDILLLFRVDEYIFIADIKSMFRMILLDPKYKSLQNILWRDSPKNNIQCLQLNTVTYGLKSSSYLATRCLKELADKYKEEFPLAAFIIENSMYVDDALVSQKTSELLTEAKRQLCSLLNRGGFQLHKWFSNCPQLLKEIPKSQQHLDNIDLEKDNYIKTLGVKYDTVTDSFLISSPQSNANMPLTKRDILSFIGKFYDPLGLAGPIIVLAKVIMQRLWKAQVGWDEHPPHDLLKAWSEFYDGLQSMLPITTPRYTGFCKARSIQIVGFADASNSAYGCCVYLGVLDDLHNVKVSLLCSKSRVNSLKQKLTMPRLELNAAVLLAKLVARIHSTLKLKLIINDVILYSDSQIVLAWLKTNINTLNTYVANRVKIITELTDKYIWSYISSDENAADSLSRGILPHKLQGHPLWWNGPDNLQGSDYKPVSFTSILLPCKLPEINSPSTSLKSMVCTTLKNILDLDFLKKFSSINKMQRILAYILRFIKNIKRNSSKNKLSYISTSELNDSLLLIIKFEQQKHFKSDILELQGRNQVLKGNLKGLCPFIDNKGLLRAGGRLENAAIAYSQKHPVILPRDSYITHLIIHNEHLKNLHAGPRLVLSSINQRFWIIHGMREVKKVIHKCIICFKLKANTAKQLMGTLPSERVNPSRPFQRIGLDFAGPILIKQSRIRKALETKAYISDGKVRVVEVKTANGKAHRRSISKICVLPIDTN